MTTTTTTTTTSTDFALEQLAPLVFVLVVPLLVLYGRNYLSEFASHMITVASSALPWNWSSVYEHGSIIATPKKKPAVRTRAEQLAARTDGRTSGASPVKHCMFTPRADFFETIVSKKAPTTYQKGEWVYSTLASLTFPGHTASPTPLCRCVPPSMIALFVLIDA